MSFWKCTSFKDQDSKEILEYIRRELGESMFRNLFSESKEIQRKVSHLELLSYQFILTFIKERVETAKTRVIDTHGNSKFSGFCVDTGINSLVFEAPFWEHCKTNFSRYHSLFSNILIIYNDCNHMLLWILFCSQYLLWCKFFF